MLALRRLNKHLLCEKPLATTLADCRALYTAVTATAGGAEPILFAVGHVLRYSPHNTLLHQLVVADRAVGDIVNINHTEPVGYWHFAHSYVRYTHFIVPEVKAWLTSAGTAATGARARQAC